MVEHGNTRLLFSLGMQEEENSGGAVRKKWD
jgi:hypothetical protein